MSKPTCFLKGVFFKLTLFLNLNLYFCLPENHFGDCLPKKCGDININYPFHIKEQQKSYCGYPGFEVSCKNNKLAYFNISGATYVIKNISYEKQTFQVVNSMIFQFLGNEGPCSGWSTYNLNLKSNYDVFKYAANYSEILLLLNCSQDVLLRKEFQSSEICGAVAMYQGDTRLRALEGQGKCSEVVSVPYEGENDNVRNVSEKLEQGFSLKWTANNCSACIETKGQCGYDQTVSEFACYCPDRTHAYQCVPPLHSKKKKKLPLVLGLGIGGITLMVAAIIVICYRKRLKFAPSKFVAETVSLDRSGSDIEKGSVYFGVPLFTYTELQEATDNFDQSRELGDGGFGTVYYGKLRDGREVAVKRLYEKNYRRVEQFMNEVQILTCLRHQNLVSLYGCTSHHSKELLLVYEFVPNGTVADHLYGDRATTGSLPWARRLRIAIETASALCYLHASDIIHRDVKTHNILLDSNFSVKVADFGLSRLFPNHVSHVSTAPQGTPGYLDPEYHQCYQLTDKSDVYSFGVVLVELISSLPAVDMSRHRHEINLSNYAMTRIQRCAFDELVDPGLGFLTDLKVKRMTTAVGELAFQCLQHDKEFRPAMDEILEVLQRIESTNYEALQAEELARNNAGVQGTKLPLSPIEDDHAKLLSNDPPQPSSPISVMDKWGSKSTTPSTSK